MFRCIKLKHSVLPAIPVLNSYSQQFHVSAKKYVRRISPKNSSNNVEPTNLKSDFDPSLILQNSSVDFFGIESDEGVITLGTPQNPSQHIQRRNLKEKFHCTSFGIVRYDADNKLKYHGQYKNKTDFLFPYKNCEYAEVSKSLQKLPNPSENYLKVFYNKNENCELDSFQKKERDENNSDEYCFGKISDRENTDYKNDATRPSPDELSYLDKNYFGTLTISENPISDKERDGNFNEKEHCTKDSSFTESAPQEFNFIDENYFKNSALSETQKSPKNMPEFSSDVLVDAESTFECSKKETSELNNIVSFYTNLKSDIADDLNPNPLINNTTSIVENNHILEEYADFNEPNVAFFSPDIKNRTESFIESDDMKINRYNEISNEDCGPTLKQVLQDNFGNFSPPQSLDNAIESDFQTVKSAIIEKKLKHLSHASGEPDDVSTAHDFVTKLRKERDIPQVNIKKDKAAKDEKFDSKGFRILKNQVDDLAYFTRDEILNMLKCSVVYSDDDLLILNKPYGLVMHDSQTTKDPCLSTFLNDLAKELDRKTTDPKLFTVHRLDKETTGCLLLARNETKAQYLKSLFVERKIIKKYLIVTTRVPDPTKAIIDIPISEGSVNKKRRMVLHPKIPKDIAYRNHSSSGKEAITSYKVLSESGNAAVVEAVAKTGIKHQIRVHFGFGLSCPILGDHKYSHIDKLAPQKLPSDILQKLKVRQSKVRYIPMHIHAKSVIIPDYFERRDLVVNIPLPNHMKINLKRLKFKKRDIF